MLVVSGDRVVGQKIGLPDGVEAVCFEFLEDVLAG